MVNFNALCLVASKTRGNLEPCAATACEISQSKFTYGWYNLVFEIGFSDKTFWIARIPIVQEDHDGNEEEITNELESEVATMKYVKNNTTIPVPVIFAFSSTPHPDVGCRFILMESLPGVPGTGRFKEFVPDEYKQKTFRQFVDIKLQLSQCRFPRIGRLREDANVYKIESFRPFGCLYSDPCGPFDTSIDYYYSVRKHDLQKAVNDRSAQSDISQEQRFGTWLRLQAVPVIVQLEFNHGPFPLDHPDLNVANLLFDNEFNITGVIDWTGAFVAPIESFGLMPIEFPRYSKNSKDSNVNLIWNLIEDAERLIDPSTPLSKYIQSSRSAGLAAFEIGDRRGEKITMQLCQSLVRSMYGDQADYTMVKSMFENSCWVKALSLGREESH